VGDRCADPEIGVRAHEVHPWFKCTCADPGQRHTGPAQSSLEKTLGSVCADPVCAKHVAWPPTKGKKLRANSVFHKNALG